MNIRDLMRRSHSNGQQPGKLVAVVVPLSTRDHFTAEETISLRHLTHYLGRYDKYMLAPASRRMEVTGVKVLPFPDGFFGSPTAHDRMMFSERFYRTFEAYKYILVYHLDSLVLSDQLEEWCGADLDFIGPPWLKCPDSPWVKVERVGNSGFALIKVSSFLKVINSPVRSIEPDAYWEQYYASKPAAVRLFNLPRRYLKHLRMFNCAKWEMRRWLESNHNSDMNSDMFWSDAAPRYYPGFKIASVEQGLQFAFEVAPRLCFERNNRRFPFGCHAWARYDRAFWKPYLLDDTSRQPVAPVELSK